MKREFERISGLYSTLVNLNRALRGAHTPQEVFQETCRVTAAHSGFRLVWIGRHDRDERQVVPVAHAGGHEDYVEALRIYTDERPESRGPTATCIREEQTSVFNDFLGDPRAQPWHARARNAGFRAVTALPIRFRKVVWGALMVYAHEPDVFGDREVALLEDLALDISLALDAIDAETQRREAESALARREQELSTVLRSAHDGFLLMDLEGRLLATNDSYCELTGFTEAEVLARRIWDLDVFLSRSSLQEVIHEIIVERQDKRFETVHQRKDGSTVEVEVTANPLPGVAGKLVTFMRDITDRKRAAAEIEQRLHLEERLSSIAATVPGMIYSFRMHADGHLSVPYASPNCTKLFGVTPDQVENDFSPALANVHPSDREHFLTSIVASAHTLEPWRGAFRVVHPERGEVWLDAHSVPCSEPDGSIVWVGYIHDVTDQRTAEAALRVSEAQLRHAQKMDAMGRLAGGIAHDFGNLLLIIDGYCTCILEDGVPARFTDSVKQVQQAAQRANTLTRQLLAFGQGQVGTPRRLDLDDVVSGTSQMIGRLLGSHIELEHARSRQEVTVFADAEMLDQVLLNLAMNARDAMGNGGRLTIATSTVECDDASQHPGAWACILISDTGVGIPPDLVPRIFEPFFTTKRKGKGTGLGLASVYGIVEQHHGWVDVESVESKGTNVRVYLPLLASADEVEEEVTRRGA